MGIPRTDFVDPFWTAAAERQAGGDERKATNRNADAA